MVCSQKRGQVFLLVIMFVQLQEEVNSTPHSLHSSFVDLNAFDKVDKKSPSTALGKLESIEKVSKLIASLHYRNETRIILYKELPDFLCFWLRGAEVA